MTTDTNRKIAGEARELAPREIDPLPAAEFEKLSEADKQRDERFVKSMEAEKNNDGYANHETRAVCLWLENDEESWGYWMGAAKEATEMAATCWEVRDRIWEARRAPAYLLATRLEGEMTEGMPVLGAGLYSKLLGSALYEVEWHEVAEAILEAEFWSQAF